MAKKIFLSLPAQKLLALAAYGEAGGEGMDGMRAVLNVIRNRTTDPNKFASQDILTATKSLYHAVILKPYQFSAFNSDSPLLSKLEALAKNFDSKVKIDPTLKKAYDLSGQLQTGLLDDNTMGATYYHATSILPFWANSIPLIGQIGNHVFYGLNQVRQTVAKAVENPKTWVTAGMIAAISLGVIMVLSSEGTKGKR